MKCRKCGKTTFEVKVSELHSIGSFQCNACGEYFEAMILEF